MDDVTITLSEVYCNEQAIYLSMEIKSEEVIPDIYAPQLFTTEKYSFNSSVLSDCPVLNGERIDDHTYAGLIRLDLNDKKIDSAAVEKKERNSDTDVGATDVDYMDLLKVVEIPETFTLDLSIDEINIEKKIIAREYERLQEFAKLAINGTEAFDEFLSKWEMYSNGGNI